MHIIYNLQVYTIKMKQNLRTAEWFDIEKIFKLKSTASFTKTELHKLQVFNKSVSMLPVFALKFFS